ncbi:MAG TPA: PTS IIA-like nitrogen regulatory protein PtsN [Casimicrobiaceae bacterium]|nr:PTS IIA-like nitrogen regulatory protein PtsN [Casimicrobiaceae bacterium]
MNQIAPLLPEANIALNLDASSKKRLFEQIGQLFETQSQIARSVVFDSLFARERLGSTGLGQGIAIPHGRIKGLKQATGAFVRPLQPIPFDAPDGKPVEQVFVLLVPEQATEEHLQLLSELAQMFSERSFREQVARAADPAEVREVFASWQSGPQ